MSKNEIARFKIRYKIFSKTDGEKIGVWLSNAVDFDRPDGYYYDADNKLLVIFEHFDIDCSERITKNGKSNGSILRKNSHDVYQQVQKELQVSEDDYESTKVIEQGYFEQDGDRKICYVGEDGDKYRNNYINNFIESFESHTKKIEEYKSAIINHLGIQPVATKIVFLVEDKTIMGTYYLTDKRSPGKPVILTETLQFQEAINCSSVDYLIAAREGEKIALVGYKGDPDHKIDLRDKEFYVIPVGVHYTVAKKLF